MDTSPQSATTSTPPASVPDEVAVAASQLQPPRTIPEVLGCMQVIQRAAEAGPLGQQDGVAAFNHLYTIITTDVLAKIDAGNFFEDDDYLTTLDIVFARRYLNGLAANVRPEEGPKSWGVLLAARSNPHITALQFASAGVNAHVNFDLPFALIETCRQMNRPFGAGSQRRDYQTINRIFADTMSQVRHHLECRILGVLDVGLVDHVNDRVGDLTVILARDAAWHHAEELWPLRDDAAAMADRSEALDTLVSLAGRGILAPAPS